MFAPRYFGVRYYPPRFFAPGAADLIVQQPIPDTRSAPAGGPLLRKKPRRPRIEAYTPVWEYYEEAILAVVAKHGNREKDLNDALLLLQNVAFGPLAEVANILFRMKLRGIPHKTLLDLLYFLTEDEKEAVSGLVQQKVDNDEIITLLLLDGGL